MCYIDCPSPLIILTHVRLQESRIARISILKSQTPFCSVLFYSLCYFFSGINIWLDYLYIIGKKKFERLYIYICCCPVNPTPLHHRGVFSPSTFCRKEPLHTYSKPCLALPQI